jgi:hypothetical protein
MIRSLPISLIVVSEAEIALSDLIKIPYKLIILATAIFYTMGTNIDCDQII